jgi:hypothetical protein
MSASASLPLKMCSVCEFYCGDSVVHGAEGCPHSKSVLCRRCHHRGHLTSDCTADYAQWERPTALEELIPADVRLRYRISSHTPLTFTAPRGAVGTESELGDINEVVIPDAGDPEFYKKLGEFMKDHNIKVDATSKRTKESASDRVRAIKAWGTSRGYRIVQKVTEPAPVPVV